MTFLILRDVILSVSRILHSAGCDTIFDRRGM